MKARLCTRVWINIQKESGLTSRHMEIASIIIKTRHCCGHFAVEITHKLLQTAVIFGVQLTIDHFSITLPATIPFQASPP